MHIQTQLLSVPQCIICSYPHSLTRTPPEWLKKMIHHTVSYFYITSISFHFLFFFLHFFIFCCFSCFQLFLFVFVKKCTVQFMFVWVLLFHCISFVFLILAFLLILKQNRNKNEPPLPIRWQEPFFNVNLNLTLESISLIVLHFLYRYISLFYGGTAAPVKRRKQHHTYKKEEMGSTQSKEEGETPLYFNLTFFTLP